MSLSEELPVAAYNVIRGDNLEIWKKPSGKVVYLRNGNGYEFIIEYDKYDRQIHVKDSEGYEFWRTYSDNMLSSHKDSDGFECTLHGGHYATKEDYDGANSHISQRIALENITHWLAI